jgi:hypothetical protein
MKDRTSIAAVPAPKAVRLMLAIALMLSALPAAAQEKMGFTFFGEVNFNWRDSDFVEHRLNVPFPPDFWEEGDDAVYLRTVDPGSHFEMSDVELGLDAQFTERFSGRALVHVIDLHNKNPTSIDEDVFVRELWLRYGQVDRPHRKLVPWAWYIEAGKAPRFAKQIVRHLESYGLWGTAVNRFEIWQAQAGVNLGGHFYLRGQYGIAGPLFMRDPNALAGDHGTEDRVPGNVNPKYNSGFPILYDARPPNFSLDGEVELGAGLGWRWANDEGKKSLDAMVWYYSRTLEDAPEIEGSYYQGDLELLRGAGFPLPFEGDEKWEAGLNVDWRLGRWVGFAQFVQQSIAELEREGFEIETAFHIPIPALFAAWDTPVFNWLRPAVRYSQIDNDFWVWDPFITPSMYWDWKKVDVGLRIGIVRSSDLTIEYTFNEAELFDGSSLKPNEWLVTWRIFW